MIRLIALTMALSAAAQTTQRVPVLLELFTSEGCSSCPPADRLLESLSDKQPVAGAELIVLSEHVDYWNYIGWKDPFSSPLFSARQNEYTDRYHLDGVYTPQLVVDGRVGLVGSNRPNVLAAIQKALPEPKIPLALSSATRDGNQVKAHLTFPAQGGKNNKAVLYVAVADDRAESKVMRGENSGRSLAHVSVVRVLKQVGSVNLGNAYAQDVSLTAQPGASGAKLVAFLQDSVTGHILGTATIKL